MTYGKRMFVFAAAVLLAGVCAAERSAATGMSYHSSDRFAAASPVDISRVGKADVVKELFPWFEIGETVDAVKLKGLKHLQTVKAKAGLRAYEEYLIVDAGMPTNDMAWVVLSVPDRKVLQMRHDIGCGSIAAARKLDKELQAKFKPLKFEGGPKLLEIMKVVDQDVGVQLSDAEFGKEVNAWLKKVDQ